MRFSRLTSILLASGLSAAACADGNGNGNQLYEVTPFPATQAGQDGGSPWGAPASDGGHTSTMPGDPHGSGGGFPGVDAGGSNVGPGGSNGGTGSGSSPQQPQDAGNMSMSTGPDPEPGRLAGITAAHNAVRAAVSTSQPLPPLVWSQTLADYAQQWADTLASTSCSNPHHRSGAELQQKGYGENLAAFGSGFGSSSTAQQAVDGWAAEKACWTYGTIAGSEQCDPTCYTSLHSDGCGHYTQVVWRRSTEVGCGVATCQNGQFQEDIWICNYSPAGNFLGETPY